MTTKTASLDVPGARLHYEVTGSGPVLLMIPGGPADASAFAGIAGLLADRYTVVTYDVRGTSRSPLSGPVDYPLREAYADDVHRLLAVFGSEPAYVLASSGGAFAALDLAARHPEQVHTVVAHEPPVTELLPDAQQHREQSQDIHDTYRREGVAAAMAKFMAGAGFGDGDDRGADRPGPPPAEMDPEMAAVMARVQGNMEYFVAHMMPAFVGYLPDFAALETASTRIVVAVGEASAGQVAHGTAVALARRLGTEPVPFPGDHGGFGSQPAAFADRLDRTFRAP